MLDPLTELVLKLGPEEVPLSNLATVDESLPNTGLVEPVVDPEVVFIPEIATVDESLSNPDDEDDPLPIPESVDVPLPKPGHEEVPLPWLATADDSILEDDSLSNPKSPLRKLVPEDDPLSSPEP